MIPQLNQIHKGHKIYHRKELRSNFEAGRHRPVSNLSPHLKQKLESVEKILAHWRQEPSTQIPPIIMQTWKTEEIPTKWRECQPSIRAQMPDWHLILLTDQEIDEFIDHFYHSLSNNHINVIFDRYPRGIHRADIIRYFWLYRYGGIYLDLDFVVQKDLSQAFDLESNFKPRGEPSTDKLYLALSSNVNSITNWFLASTPHHPYWEDIILELFNQEYRPWYSSVSRELNIINSTGPGLIDRIIRRTNHPYVLIDYQKFNPYSFCQHVYRQDTFLRPLEGSSWTTTNIYQKAYCAVGLDDTQQFLVYLILFLLLIWIMTLAVWFKFNDHSLFNFYFKRL